MKNPGMVAATVALSLVWLAEIGGIFFGVRSSRAHRRELERAGREWRQAQQIEPSPTQENANRIEEDLAQWRELLEAERSVLMGEAGAGERSTPEPAPAARANAYFELAAFVERMRDHAAKSGVRLRADERFGFAAYRQEAPATQDVSRVHRERILVEDLLEILFAAQPSELLAVQREARSTPVPGKAGAARAALRRRAAPEEADYFVPDLSGSVRSPGKVTATAFRLDFAGDTAVLRRVLNGISRAGAAMIVSSVEVASLPKKERDTTPPTNEPEVEIQPTPKRFTVVVEAFELVDAGRRET